MKFYVQHEKGKDIKDIDLLTIILTLENRTRYKLDTMSFEIDSTKITDGKAIPIGDLKYCGEYLKNVHNIKNMNPIEVPDILRIPEFLQRNYSIVPLEKVPRKGRYFVKYASKLKEFSNALSSGNVELLFNDASTLIPGLYVVSEWISLLSEYRIFVEQDEIKGIQFYNGSPIELPDKLTIRRMVNTYMLDKDRPRSYTMDIGVNSQGKTVILEVHPMVSCGLYGFYDPSLPYMYRDGIDYYKQINKELNTFIGE